MTTPAAGVPRLESRSTPRGRGSSRTPAPRGLDSRHQTLASFDWQWAHLPQGDFMPGDRWFDANAVGILADEMCAIARSWFAGKRVLDAGCGQGRWTRALLDLGAEVTAVDFSAAGLRRTEELCAGSPRLRTRQVDLLDIPADLAAERFDLVFSFGVLHHTGDTWRALDNVGGLVDERGALFLYLYGATSWDEQHARELEALRRELAALPFDAKIEELRRRFPGDDPHQLFDLMSPTINDRVRFDAVEGRLRDAGFTRCTRTLSSTEVYLRATRPGFPEPALRQPVGSRSILLREATRRTDIRRGAGFEMTLRRAVADVPKRAPDATILAQLRPRLASGKVLDASLAPDALPAFDDVDIEHRDHESLLLAPAADEDDRFDSVVMLGAAVGAGRFPGEMLAALARRVRAGGTLFVEMPTDGMTARRSGVDRLLDARVPVPTKVARLLRRRSAWCVGEALHALGGAQLVNPIPRAEAERVLEEAGIEDVEWRPGRRGTELLLGRRRS